MTNLTGRMPTRGSISVPVNVNIVSGSLSINTTGLATSTKQDTGNASLTSIDAKVPSLGQALAANSVPVILPSATVTALTPSSNAGYALDSSLSTIDTDVKSNITLHAGSNIIGKVTTDQTTHGTTDLVAADITNIGGSAVSLGQQTAAASIPVILPSATITALTPPSNIGYALDSSLTTVNTNITTLDTDLKNAQPRNMNDGLGNALVTSTSQIVGNERGLIVRTITDPYQRQIEEMNYIQTYITEINALIASESENSQRMGFEMR